MFNKNKILHSAHAVYLWVFLLDLRTNTDYLSIQY